MDSQEESVLNLLSTKQEKELKTSILPQNSSGKMPCEICGELFHKKGLNRHKSYHKAVAKKYKCDSCTKSFNVMTKLLIHNLKTHGEGMKCNKCDKKFKKISSFITHVKNHDRERLFVCNFCEFAATKKLILKNHKLVKHQIGKFPFHCKICEKGFLSNYTLNNHMNKHTGATPYQCHKCGFAYFSIKSLEYHCYKLHPELIKTKLYRCQHCSRIFKSKKNLEAHETGKHPNGRSNICDFCGKDFSFRESLVRHRRIHTGEKPKECSVCKKRFLCASYLQSHMRTHTGEKPYQCRFCWKKFSQRSSLVTHEKSHVKGLKLCGLEIVPSFSENKPP